jgi:prepilin-type processing-associated H-X9-DG protein
MAELKKTTWYYLWPGYINPNERLIWDASMQGEYRWLKLKSFVKSQDIWICPNAGGGLYTMRYALGFKVSWFARDTDNFVDGDRGFQVTTARDKDGNIKAGHKQHGEGLTITQVEALEMSGKIVDPDTGTVTPTACGSRRLPPTKKIFWVCYAIGSWGATGISNSNWKEGVFPSYSHQQGSVFVYCDGHAKYQKMGTAWAPVGYTNLAIDKDPGAP